MKTLKQKSKEINRCCLTEDEHFNLMDSLFKVKSAMRVASEQCLNHTPVNAQIDDEFLDVSNVLVMAEDKLKFAFQILDK